MRLQTLTLLQLQEVTYSLKVSLNLHYIKIDGMGLKQGRIIG
jgi:hypothetical protein